MNQMKFVDVEFENMMRDSFLSASDENCQRFDDLVRRVSFRHECHIVYEVYVNCIQIDIVLDVYQIDVVIQVENE